MTLAAVLVGAAYNALDEYETMLTTKMTPLPPFVPRKLDPDYQRYFGAAIARIGTAEAALDTAPSSTWSFCRRTPTRASVLLRRRPPSAPSRAR